MGGKSRDQNMEIHGQFPHFATDLALSHLVSPLCSSSAPLCRDKNNGGRNTSVGQGWPFFSRGKGRE